MLVEVELLKHAVVSVSQVTRLLPRCKDVNDGSDYGLWTRGPQGRQPQPCTPPHKVTLLSTFPDLVSGRYELEDGPVAL